MVAGGLNTELAFPCGGEDSVPGWLEEEGDSTASATHTLVACYFVDIDQDWGGGNVIGCDLIWERLSHEGV